MKTKSEKPTHKDITRLDRGSEYKKNIEQE